MTTMKITDRMAEAILGAVKTEDGDALRLTFKARSGTVVALMDRGLVRYDRKRTGTDSYQVNVLSARGEALREWLEARPERRSFPLNVLDAGAGVITAQREKSETQSDPVEARPKCGRKIDPTKIINEAPSELICARVPGHPGRHRDTEKFDLSSFVWDDNECVPVISTQSALNPVGSANVREVSKVLKAAGFLPRNGERLMSRSGYAASQYGDRVIVRWRDGADTDGMSNTERLDIRAAMNDAYAALLRAAGYLVGTRHPGGTVYIVGARNKR